MPADYTQARRAYLEWYSHLLSPSDDTGSELDQIEARINGLNFASEEFTLATKPYLADAQHARRMAAVDSLMHQIEGDLEVASMVWNVIAEVEDEDDAEGIITRSTRGVHLATTLRRLNAEIPVSLEETAHIYHPDTRRGSRPDNLKGAVDDLRFEIEDSVALINDRSLNVSLRLVRDILTMGHGEWAAILKGIDLLRGKEKTGDIGWGLEDEVQLAVSGIAGVLRGVLVNIVEKVLLIIEKNDLVRYTIADWLEDMKDITDSQARKKQFSNLMEQLYQTRKFQESILPVWMRDAVQVERIHSAADEIMFLGDNFERLSNQVRRLSGVISAGSLFVNPLLLSVGVGLQTGLLCTLVFAGYDHLDEGSRALNITKGVKEVLIEQLPVSKQTLELAENLRFSRIRDMGSGMLKKTHSSEE